jgi:hypothetical protein
MTEAEWLACTDPWRMLLFLESRVSARKWRLFAVACCRQHGKFMAAKLRRSIVAAAEAYADGDLTREELYAAGILRYAATSNPIASHLTDPDGAACAKRIVADWREWYSLRSMASMPAFLRDIVGNPFRTLPSLDPACLQWNDGIVPKLAQAIYEGRAFDHLPILADALEEASCTDAGILNHCRQPGEHVRGCWVVDLLLGKS